MDYLKKNGCSTVGEISDQCPDVMALPVQKLSQLMGRLYNQGILHRTGKDRKAYFEAL